MKRADSKKNLPVLGHIAELRKLAIISISSAVAASIISFVFYEEIINLLYRPLEVLEKDQIGHLLYINTIFEGFITRLKISLLSGFVLSFPVHLLNLVLFIFPGLERKEKNVVSVSLLCSFLFIILSFLYSYYKIIPISVVFLTGDGFIPEKTGMLLSFSGNIFYILQFMLVALVVFQVPIILEILMVMNVVKRKALWRASRYVVVLFFVLAAVITPPDFVTQISIALPLTVLYLLTLLIAKVFGFGER